MTIEAVMIVKNEEQMLSRCLDSLKGIDSIVIVDTGSEDNTIEIAKKYTDKIYHFKWCNDFSKARNVALSKATCDFVLIIDADEMLKTPISEVRAILEKEKGTKVFGVKTTAENGSDSHMSARLWKNLPEIRYKGKIHELINHSIEKNTDIEIIYGSSPTHITNPDLDFEILKEVVKDDPSVIRERYYLAREYWYRKQYKKCITETNKYLKVANWLPEKNDAYLMRARCLAALGKYEEACDSAWKAVEYNTNFKEAILFIADHMDPINKQRWLDFAKGANNEGVLFIRDIIK